MLLSHHTTALPRATIITSPSRLKSKKQPPSSNNHQPTPHPNNNNKHPHPTSHVPRTMSKVTTTSPSLQVPPRAHHPSSMPATEFPKFLSLPFELRAEIYWLATPSRVVPVHEVPECIYNFQQRLRSVARTLPMGTEFRSRPTVAACTLGRNNMVRDRRWLHERAAFAFFSDEPTLQPKTSVDDVPTLPMSFLASRMDMAYELVRQGYFRSGAPIPPFLHVCSESRAELIKGGYELAFHTPTAGPRTWFHFDRDTLYIPYDDRSWDPCRWLYTGTAWNLGQFDPAELRKVNRLALSRAAPAVEEHIVTLPTNLCPQTTAVTRVLEEFDGLQELFLGMWEEGDLTGGPQSQAKPDSALKDPLQFIEMDELDALTTKWMDLELVESQPQLGPCTGCDLLKLYLKLKARRGNVVPGLIETLREAIESDRDRRLNSSPGSTPLNIPKMIAGHFLCSSMANLLEYGRESLAAAATESELMEMVRKRD